MHWLNWRYPPGHVLHLRCPRAASPCLSCSKESSINAPNTSTADRYQFRKLQNWRTVSISRSHAPSNISTGSNDDPIDIAAGLIKARTPATSVTRSTVIQIFSQQGGKPHPCLRQLLSYSRQRAVLIIGIQPLCTSTGPQGFLSPFRFGRAETCRLLGFWKIVDDRLRQIRRIPAPIAPVCRRTICGSRRPSSPAAICSAALTGSLPSASRPDLRPNRR